MDDERPLTKIELRERELDEQAAERRKARAENIAEYRAQFKLTQTRLVGDNDHWIPPSDPRMIFFTSEDNISLDRVDETGRLFFGNRPVSDEHIEQYWEYLRELRIDDAEAFKRLLTRYQHVEDEYLAKLIESYERRKVRKAKWEAKREHEKRIQRLPDL